MADSDAPEHQGEQGRERVFTVPLVVFLVLVLGFDAFTIVRRCVAPDLATSIVELADGDMDGDERDEALGQVRDQGPSSAKVLEQWAGMLAAIALGDPEANNRALVALGGAPVPTRVPEPADREFAGLGDTMLANISAALIAEVEADRSQARVLWHRVAAQSRLRGHAFAAELAAAALQRLG